MARERTCFKVKVEFEKDEMGNPGHEPMTIAVMRVPEARILTADDAVKHLTFVIGKNPFTGKDVTRIHHKDNDTGEFFSIVSAVPVEGGPFPISQVPVVKSIEDAPKAPTAPPQ